MEPRIATIGSRDVEMHLALDNHHKSARVRVHTAPELRATGTGKRPHLLGSISLCFESSAVEIDIRTSRSIAECLVSNRSTLFLKEFMINRRQFISAAATASTASLWAQQTNEWGGPV